jgi:hypothetical protein
MTPFHTRNARKVYDTINCGKLDWERKKRIRDRIAKDEARVEMMQAALQAVDQARPASIVKLVPSEIKPLPPHDDAFDWGV